jgi:hypothetical protein
MTGQPTSRADTDRALNDTASLPPAATTADTAAIGPDHVTAREIVEFLRHLAEFRAGARYDDPRADARARAAFQARKADLFTRIAANPPASTAPEGRIP